MNERESARSRREHRIRVVAWLILLVGAAIVLLRFVELPGWGQATVVVVLILLAILGFVISHRRAKTGSTSAS